MSWAAARIEPRRWIPSRRAAFPGPSTMTRPRRTRSRGWRKDAARRTAAVSRSLLVCSSNGLNPPARFREKKEEERLARPELRRALGLGFPFRDGLSVIGVLGHKRLVFGPRVARPAAAPFGPRHVQVRKRRHGWLERLLAGGVRKGSETVPGSNEPGFELAKAALLQKRKECLERIADSAGRRRAGTGQEKDRRRERDHRLPQTLHAESLSGLVPRRAEDAKSGPDEDPPQKKLQGSSRDTGSQKASRECPEN